MPTMKATLIGFLSVLAYHVHLIAADETTTVTKTIYLPATALATAQATVSPTNPASIVDTDAGAAGSTPTSIGLSKGGLIAVSVVVALVAIFGVASTVLYVIAKRRQWNVRASVARASRRLTGRAVEPRPARTSSNPDRRSRKPMYVDATASRSGVNTVHSAGRDRPVIIDARDVEKGSSPKASQEPIEMEARDMPNNWMHRLRGNDWK